ncbi:MAG TPA: hypothetical protein VGM73_16220 [Candidatus Didemnitutus sp.]|jgi:hypothetical protein
MNPFEGFLLLALLSGGLVVAGYPLATLLDGAAPAVRLACASLAGLSVLLLEVSLVNLIEPLSPAWACACLLPIGVTAAWPRCRATLAADCLAVWRRPGRGWLLLLAGVFIGGLLLPMLVHPSTAFYDGTSNHDSFFWISNAEYLKRHPYLVPPPVNPTHPFLNNVAAITGFEPSWGRMGAEGLLALASSLAWTAPLKLYLYGTACLFTPWVAAVYLALRTFWSSRLTLPALIGLVALQPVFIFFFANSNLPNLVGAITGATAIIACERLLRPRPGDANSAWWWLLILGWHGLACSYPEMIPFVLFPCGLLWLRAGFGRGRTALRPCAAVVAALAMAAAINPATAWRACHGFVVSFVSARANESWANLFQNITPFGIVPALGTLSVSALHLLGNFGGVAATILVVVAAVAAWLRSEDRFGATVVFAGSAALAVYTLATGFTYGWQKTAQFAGVFVAAAPAAALATAVALARAAGWRRWIGRLGAVAAFGFLAFCTTRDFADNYTWSTRKWLARDWFDLRDESYRRLRGAPILIEAASFRMSFFYGMWSAYFLPESRLYYGARGQEAGGYLRETTLHEGRQPLPAPKGYLVSRAWAETFDANSPRIFSGSQYALLEHANRMLALAGVYPLDGPPEYAADDVSMEILPHHAALLTLELMPRQRTDIDAGTWELTRQAPGQPDFSREISGPPPWRLEIPLTAGARNRIRAHFSPAPKSEETNPFLIRSIRVDNAP